MQVLKDNCYDLEDACAFVEDLSFNFGKNIAICGPMVKGKDDQERPIWDVKLQVNPDLSDCEDPDCLVQRMFLFMEDSVDGPVNKVLMAHWIVWNCISREDDAVPKDKDGIVADDSFGYRLTIKIPEGSECYQKGLTQDIVLSISHTATYYLSEKIDAFGGRKPIRFEWQDPKENQK